MSIEIKPGIVTSLIGPSGCGKTTLLRSFNRINERYGNVTTKGEIRILGKNILDPDVSVTSLRKSVGMVFQRPNPLPISIYENVIFGLKSHTPASELSRSEIDGHVEIGPAGCRPLGDDQGQFETEGDGTVTRGAAETVHCPASAVKAQDHPDG